MRSAAMALFVILFASCSQPRVEVTRSEVSAIVGSPADPSPSLAFTQDGLTVGLNRANKPSSLAGYTSPPSITTFSHGTLMYDFDGDGILDVFDMNHGQGASVSGLWLGTGAGFGPNIWAGAMQPAAGPTGSNLGLTQNMAFVGDMTGDGRVDLYLNEWSGGGTLCTNQGNATHSDWSGPSFICYHDEFGLRFGDANGDGKIDVETLDLVAAPYDNYRDMLRTLPRHWRLNNGSPDISTWPAASDFALAATAAPGALFDINGDGLPDRIQGVESSSRVTACGFSGRSDGTRVYLGQDGGTYALVTSGLEAVVDPISAQGLQDVNGDGCVDVGVDCTVYKNAQSWWVQNKSGSTCLATFASAAGLGYITGEKRYDVDLDNDGIADKITLDLDYWGSPHGAHLYRRTSVGALVSLGNLGIDIAVFGESYAQSVGWQFGDWNGDGAIDVPGVGTPSIPNSDSGIALWTSHLVTTNRWIKVRTPEIRGFFTGAAKIEVFDAGHLGEPDRLASAPRVLRTGEAWDAQVHHFGVGVRSSVDVRVTLGNGTVESAATVPTNSTVTISATPPPPDTTPPTISIASLRITPIAADDSGLVASVSWSLDGSPVLEATMSPWELSIDVTTLPQGQHVVSAVARDAAGNASASASIGVTR